MQTFIIVSYVAVLVDHAFVFHSISLTSLLSKAVTVSLQYIGVQLLLFTQPFVASGLLVLSQRQWYIHLFYISVRNRDALFSYPFHYLCYVIVYVIWFSPKHAVDRTVG